MYGDTWQVRWKEFLSDSYVYGSKIEFNEDGSVSYKNRLMPPGTVIHTWYSMTNFQGNRIEPSLPLIDGERAYSIAVNIDYHNSESEALMLRIIFFDRYDAQAQSIIVRDKKAFFKPSIRTYSYRIELINGGNADFTFKSLVIKEVSEEEFDAEQERIERLKEDSNKSKKKRRKNLSDEELSALTEQFKSRYSDGESLESLMPEAFAAICEADYRVLGKRPYDVQILAAAALHGGYLAEMNTGEGKTLSATMPLYLNALTGKSCMLVTTNEYLASRDGAEMGAVYNFMGLTCSYPDADDTKKQDDDEKRQFYSADIIYTTNGALGFDFLFDNLVKKKEDRFLCDFHYVIIDEADSVLLDSAIMPLVISGVPRVQSNLYDVCDFFVTTLVEDIDYIEEDKAVWLTPKGVKFAESFFGISNFYGKENFEINRHVTLSLRAHKLLKNKKDYVVTDKKEVELFDGATGRLMHGVKLRGGQHQAIEAKEKVEISQEYRTVASVTFQNLFMMFDKMAGMSGTLMDAKDELFETYGKHVVKIPTNRPLKRVDRKDRYFKNGHDQFWTAVDDVIRLHETGQPVLVVLNSVTDTDLFSRLLIEKNIPHNVLNASNAFWEAQIIAGAGQMNAVTVATTMAGRGTDIKLGDGVKELGGLAVIGIGRMNNSRSERQARGRAGRQGDPGFSQYYVSLEDDIVGAEDDDKLQRYIDGKKRIGKRKIKRIVNQCQKLSVESEEMNRKKSLQYDQVLQRQRDLIYATRKNLLDGASVEQEKIVEIAKENISDFVNNFDCIQSNKKHGRRRGRKKDNDKNTNTEQYTSILNRYILDNISYKLDAGLTLSDMQSAATVSDYLMLRVYQGLSRQRERIGDEEAYEQFVREATLKAVDDGWVELIDYLEQLKYAVAGRASAQRNVMFEYQNEAFESFLDTEKAVKCNIIRNILLSDVKIGKDGRLHVIYP